MTTLLQIPAKPSPSIELARMYATMKSTTVWLEECLTAFGSWDEIPEDIKAKVLAYVKKQLQRGGVL